MAQEINIQYTDKNFSSLRENLIELAKNYFPDTYNDFSPSSPGMMFIEMAAYVGDILSFYQDTQLQETYLQYAKDPGNLYSMAYMMGYRPKTTTASNLEVSITQRVEATGSSYKPNFNQAAQIESNIVVTGNGEDFIIDKPIDFSFSSSYDPTDVTIYSLDSDGEPAEYLLTKSAKAQAGKIVTTTETVGASSKFLTLTIDDSNIIGIVSIVDSNGTEWTEVPYLGQDTVFTEAINTGNNSDKVPYLLSATKVPNRFVTRFNSTGQLLIQFGAGMSSSNDDVFLPNPTVVGSGTNQGIRRTDHAYDPSNFLFSSAYGNSPSNVQLTIKYLKGGGVKSNIPANTVGGATYTAAATDTTTVSTISFSNPKPGSGGKDGDTIEEIRQNSLRSFNEQGRIITKQDYAFRAMTMPSTLGSIAKTFVTTDADIPTANNALYNPLGVCLYVLGYDVQKKLTQATAELKSNLKTYLSEFKALTDGCTVKDAFIINLGINYDIITRPGYNSREVLLNCTNALKAHFNIEKWAINQPINISSLYTILDRIKGVQTVQDITFETKVGNSYSSYDYDVKGAIKNNILYPSLDPMIFEIKFPNSDIRGRITTL